MYLKSKEKTITQTAALISGLLLAFWFFDLTYEKQLIKASLDMRKELEKSVSMISDDLNASTEVLYSLSNLITTFDHLTEKEFKKFTKHLSTRKKSILMIEWQPRVLGSEREEFIKRARKLGQKSFELLEPDGSGNLIKAKQRDVHYPVLYGVSTRNQSIAVGLDLAWSKKRMASKYQARDMGAPLASNTFPVLHNDSNQETTPGFAITLPVYTEEMIPQSLEERRKSLKGFLASVIYIREFLAPIKNNFKNLKLELRLTDLKNGEVISQSDKGADTKLIQAKEIDIYGQKWKFEVIATKAFIKSYLVTKNFLYPFALLTLVLILLYLLRKNDKNTKELITAKDKLQAALVEANKASQSKMTFLANMSHEIRTPMNAILGYSTLIKNELEKDKRDKFITKMTKSGYHLLSILNDILYVSSHDESKIKLHPQVFNINDLIKEVNDIIMTNGDQSEIQYNYEIDSRIGLLYGDTVRLKQVLINLINNAYKFTDKGEIKLSCLLTEELQDKVKLKFHVSDTGIGIDEEYIPNVFKPFTQEDETFKRLKGGVGLGLSIVSSIVKLMDGEISIDSQKNQGSVFTVLLTFEKRSKETKKDSNKDLKKSEVNESFNILIAEDDEDSTFLIKTYLKKQNFTVDYVKNGKELLESFNQSEYDLIISDIQMPELDGLSATKEIRKTNTSIPIILMSAHALPEEKEKGYMSGATDYIIKPINKNILLEAIILNLGLTKG